MSFAWTLRGGEENSGVCSGVQRRRFRPTSLPLLASGEPHVTIGDPHGRGETTLSAVMGSRLASSACSAAICATSCRRLFSCSSNAWKKSTHICTDECTDFVCDAKARTDATMAAAESVACITFSSTFSSSSVTCTRTPWRHTQTATHTHTHTCTHAKHRQIVRAWRFAASNRPRSAACSSRRAPAFCMLNQELQNLKQNTKSFSYGTEWLRRTPRGGRSP